MSKDLPPGWENAPLQDITKTFDSVTPKKEPDQTFTYVDIGSIDNKTHQITAPKTFQGRDAPSRARRVIRTGDTLFSTVRPYLRNIVLVPPEHAGDLTSTGIAVLRPADGVEPRYLHWAVLRDEFVRAVSGDMDGTLYPAVRDSDVLGQAIPLAPSPEQHRIVTKLDALFSHSRKAKQALEAVPPLLERYRQSVLAAACSGRLTEEWRRQNPDVEPAEKLLERIRIERRKRWEEDYLAKQADKGKTPKNDKWKTNYPEPATEGRFGPAIAAIGDLPDLPDGWAWATLEELLWIIKNGVGKKPDGAEANDDTKILRISSVRPMSVDLDDYRFMQDGENRFPDCMLRPGTLLFTRYNGTREFVGVCAEYRGPTCEFLHPDKLIRGEVAACDLSAGYLEIALNSGCSRSFVETRIRTTSGQAGVSGKDLREIPVPLPPAAEQAVIAKVVHGLLARLDAAGATINTQEPLLESLSAATLAAAFRGRLVAQDPSDEPASVLLERIRAERETQKSKKKARRKKRVSS